MNLIEKVNENAKRLNIEDFPFDNEEENNAFASLSEEQLKMLENDVEYGFGEKYMNNLVGDILGAAFAWTKNYGEMNSDTLFDRFHMLLNGRFSWTVVFIDGVEMLAQFIVEETKKSIDDAMENVAKRRCDYTDAAKWWDFINFDNGAYAKFLAKQIHNNCKALELEYRGVKLVIFESPVTNSFVNGALYLSR